ncbi:S-adenosyl-L-methionine-dependent methyltransferase [Xylariales sp. PMI_506]|nr:S-adenosyl-L-methionine-dependent methyltransferase [Xylariales sp. PMI_506]
MRWIPAASNLYLAKTVSRQVSIEESTAVPQILFDEQKTSTAVTMAPQEDHLDGPLAQETPDGELSLYSEALSHFSQFPAEQYLPEYYMLSSEPEALPNPLPLAPVLPSQLGQLSHSTVSVDRALGAPIAAGVGLPESPPELAQWSTALLNPNVPYYIDSELVREPSGESVLEWGSVLGESGRTYHSYKGDQSAYLLPNDPAEQDRLDIQHAMVTCRLEGRLVLAPLPRAPKLVLDVATGTGIWALEFARANPTSFVVGTDLTRIQPVPDVPNCLFERMDCEEDWMWTYKYDYIHIRFIVTGIRNPQRLIQQAFDHLNPGGWLEIVDVDMDLISDEGPDKDDRVATCYLKQWFDLCREGAAKHGVDTRKAPHYKKWLLDSGFSEVTEEKHKLPCTPWPDEPKSKQVGRWMQADYLGGLRGIAYKMLRSTGMTNEEIDVFIEATRKEVQVGEMRGYTPLYAVYGKKP